MARGMVKTDVPLYGTCSYCGKTIKLTVYQRHEIRHKNKQRVYCNKFCYDADKKGAGNPKWRGGRTITKGYAYIYNPTHPNATNQGYVCEHRLVMEKYLGRFLKPEESVHHIDGNTLNNDISNLQLKEDEALHRKLHAKYRTRDELGRFAGHKPAFFYL
jgi:hypothetical protein